MPLSSAISKVAPASVSPKEKDTSGPLVEAVAGPESIDGAGGATASTFHVRDVAADTLPKASSARTRKVCGPSARPVKLVGEPEAIHEPPSSSTSRVAPASVSLNAKPTSRPVVEAAAGPESIVGAGGATAST